MLIRDIVSPNPEITFVNDVQLGWYPDDPRNSALACNYMFTNSAPDGTKSSLDLLYLTRSAFIDSSENRFVVIATYGHGKTHFALALANFFGQPAGSPEVEGLLKRVEYASTPSKAQGLRDFKADRAPYLIVRLRGDKAPSLPQQFLSGLETALGEHAQTRGQKLPLWFDSAAQFLATLSPEQTKKAEAYLAGRGTDLANLLDVVQKKQTGLYDLCRDLSKHLHGTPLDFGAEISLEQAVMQASDAYCGDGKPFSGILILFDEFSAFIQKYAEWRGGGSTASLQDLLDGVGNCRDRVVFIAFSQHDPDQVADNIYRAGSDADGRDTLGKELTRLPVPQRNKLYSSLETVIKAYLNQDAVQWEELYERAVGPLEEATDRTMSLFDRLYDDRLGWGTERVAEIITQGCFPLHPITTAMLCSVELRQVTNPRAVLGFVLEALKDRSDQPALLDTRPNWVYAVDLVDWFGEMLSEKEWEQYSAVRQRLGGDITEEQSVALKAMLLQAVRPLKTKGIGYAGLVCLLSGFPRSQCENVLQELSEGGYIQHDTASGADTYTFWTAGASGDKLDREVNKRLAPTLDINAINAEWRQTDRLGPIPMDVNWGYAKDYAAGQYLLTRASFTPGWIKKLATAFHLDPRNGFSEADRGFLFWLVAEKDEDLDWFREQAKSVLEQALPGENPPPVVLALPTEARPHFLRYIQRERAYRDLPQEVKQDYGREVLHDAERRYRQAVDGELRQLKVKPDFECPAPYRAAVGLTGPVTDHKRYLDLCYKAAYRSAPPAFFMQYATGNSNLSKAVWQMSRYLAENRLTASKDLQDTLATVRDLMRNYLRQGATTSWGLVTHDDALQAPVSARIHTAWDVLDRTFAAGKSPVALRDALLPLLNAPFGYDYNHAILILSAWYGFNRTGLKMQNGASTTALSDLLRNPGKPRELIMALCGQGMTISRRDKNTVFLEIAALVEKINDPTQFSRMDAKTMVNSLTTLMREEKLGDLHESVQGAIERLEAGLTRSEEYAKIAAEITTKVSSQNTITPLTQMLKRLAAMPVLGCVRADNAQSLPDLRQMILDQLAGIVNRQCQQYSALSDLTKYEFHKRYLSGMKIELKDIGQSDFFSRIDAALGDLDAALAKLKDRQQDSAIVAEVRSMPTYGSLQQAREYLSRLEALKPHEAETNTLIAEKTDALYKAVVSQEQFIQNLPGRLDNVAQLTDARQLQQEIQRRHDSYANTPEMKVIEAAAKRCRILEDMLNRLSLLQQMPLRSPEDAQSKRSQAAALREETKTHLSSPQIALFDVLREEIDRQVAARENDALNWLRSCAKQVQSGTDLAAVLPKLLTLPPFLPDDRHQEVNDLRMQVQQKLDEDEVTAITTRFRRIADPAKRKACLKALEQIADGRE